MKSIESSVAKSCLHRDWAEQIRECQSRPAGMTVAQWCENNGITKDGYYYRLRVVRRDCLDQVSQPIVPVPLSTLKTKAPSDGTRLMPVKGEACMSVSAGKATILVAGNTPPELLKTLLEVVINAE